MKYCRVCERHYDDELRVCGIDGTPLEFVGEQNAKRDAYIGRTIKGRYQIVRKLGEGGMGTVYLAKQISMGRNVAVKILQGSYASDDEFVDRFRREARVAASLNHPNIVTVYDFDQADDGALFIAMEYVDGQRLTDIIDREGPLDIRRAVRLGVQIGEGLEAAHRAGVIHRDIKPDNIMVVGEPHAEKIKLMDFGIARLRDSGSTSRLTRAGVIMGTPAYMAPEQAEGADVSEQTDIYALGIVLYEMLSASVPFRAPTPGAVLMKHLQEMPLGLSKLRGDAPTAVVATVMQALEKKPQRRQRDMRELIQGLTGLSPTMASQVAWNNTVFDAAAREVSVPTTIQATQIAIGKHFNKLKPFNSNLLSASLLVFVVAVSVVFGVVRFADWLGRDSAPGNVNRDPGPVSGETLPIPPTSPDPKAISAERAISSQPVSSGSKSTPEGTILSSPPSPHSKRETVSLPPVSAKPKPLGRSTTLSSVSPGPTPTPASVAPPQPGSPRRNKMEPADPPTEFAKPAMPDALKEKILKHMKLAKLHREKGEYANAQAELQKARNIEPDNKAIQAEIEMTRRACNAERKILEGTNLQC